MSTSAKYRPTWLKIASAAFVAVWVIIAAFPFVWTFWGSFKVELDFFSIADWTNALTGERTKATYGSPFTGAGYYGAWVQEEFWRNVMNTAIVCFFVVCTSLTIGTLGAYALSRSGYNYVFWLLIAALIFRAMPPITLVSGYLPPFFQWNLWGHLPTSIIVLVAINQPFTLWMLHSFFQKIPKELDESAKVDGCTQFQAFRLVIIPVMWPGVITTGLFSFLLAYNDFAVTTLLLREENRTMVPEIAAFLGTTYTEGNVMFAVAAVVSAAVPLFLLVMFFQRQIVSGLTAGAVLRMEGQRAQSHQSIFRNSQNGARFITSSGAVPRTSGTQPRHGYVEDRGHPRGDRGHGRWSGLNDHRIADIGEFFSESFRWMGNQGCGTKEGLREFQDNWQKPFQAAFHDKVCIDEARLYMGEWAAAFGRQEATHGGDFMGVKATGKRIEIRYMDFWKVVDGKIVDNWVMVDFPHVLAQLGVDVFGGEGWEHFDSGAKTPPSP